MARTSQTTVTYACDLCSRGAIDRELIRIGNADVCTECQEKPISELIAALATLKAG